MIDRAKFSCNVSASPDLIKDPQAFLSDLDQLTADVSNKSRIRRGVSGSPSFIVSLLPEQAVRVFISEGGSTWAIRSVEFNSLKVLDGHNGNPNRDFCESVAELKELLAPLLKKPEGINDVIPGLTASSSSYWTLLELVRHIPFDPLVLAAFANSRHVAIRKPPLICPGESARFGCRDGNRLSIYAKHKEMARIAEKFRAAESPPVLRLEVTLKKKSLPLLLGQQIGKRSNLRTISDEERLVKFSRQDCVKAHELAFEGFKGVYGFDHPGQGLKDKTARFIAAVHRQFELPVDALLRLYESVIGEPSSTTVSKLRGAVTTELERTSRFSLAQLLERHSDSNQPAILIPVLEKSRKTERRSLSVDPLIREAYGHAKSFQPHVTPEALL
jgi:hypothetical protein